MSEELPFMNYSRAVAIMVCMVCMAGLPAHLHAQTAADQQAQAVELDTSQMFLLADKARSDGDYKTAEAIYRALAAHADGELRYEARFRLALMLAYQQKRYRAAAIELRRILDEKPDTARVRLELARIDALLGHIGDAGRELRAVKATGLPPDVEKAVRFYAQALDSRRPTGGSIEATLAPDSNINRATASGTLPTTIGNFILNSDARAHSGLGGAVRAQGFVRIGLNSRSSVLARLSGSALIYGSARFDDFILAPQIGPEWTSSRNRMSLAVGPAWRWYGTVPYTFALTASGNWQHAMGQRSQLRVDASFAHISNFFDPLETGNAESLSVAIDHAISARMGGGLQVSVSRQGARDPGYATMSERSTIFLYREMGQTTITGSVAYGHLQADQRLSLFLNRRVDHDYMASLTGTFRQLRIGAIAPLARLTFEHQTSSVPLYSFQRISGEIGIASAF